ncbi:MAG TPA: DUF1566 domain-containing protein [Burkholderiaceae bacterium]|nr:DUF1566 domain-containing protein [Burkholderiaceae bacterium]
MKYFYTLLISFTVAVLAACGSSNTNNVAADFSVNGIKGSVNGQQVTIDLTSKEACSTLTSLVLSIQANGASVSPDPTVARDYSHAVDFTITLADGTKTVYTVTVIGKSCTDSSGTGAGDNGTQANSTTPTTTECGAATNGTTGYSLVFKGCDANNVATYYDKTECVRDNSTGLIWQGQTGPGTGLRANDNYLTNFDKTTGNQKLSGGMLSNVSQADIDATSNSIGFKNAINASNLCGFSDWRLPDTNELLWLIKTNNTPQIDNLWFPNVPNVDNNHYWTSTASTQTYWAYAIRFSDDGGNNHMVSTVRYYPEGPFTPLVRLVR